MNSIAFKLVNKLKKKKLKVSFAESCTGGIISSMITSISGSSEVFNFSIVTYSNESKHSLLNVSRKTIKKYGAVSKEVCMSMLENLSKVNKGNISLSVTGVAGPNGGTKEKPVGLVFIGLKNMNKTIVKKFFFKNKSRSLIQKAAAKKALILILNSIK
jgi:nicotinamide-nucleotide amidase